MVTLGTLGTEMCDENEVGPIAMWCGSPARATLTSAGPSYSRPERQRELDSAGCGKAAGIDTRKPTAWSANVPDDLGRTRWETPPQPTIEERVMTAEVLTSIRELDRRVTNGVQVRLLWCGHDVRLWVAALNPRNGDAFCVEVREDERPLERARHYGCSGSMSL